MALAWADSVVHTDAGPSSGAGRRWESWTSILPCSRAYLASSACTTAHARPGTPCRCQLIAIRPVRRPLGRSTRTPCARRARLAEKAVGAHAHRHLVPDAVRRRRSHVRGTPTQRDRGSARASRAATPAAPPAARISPMPLRGYIFSLVLRAVEPIGRPNTARSITSPGAAPTTFVFAAAPGADCRQLTRSDYGYPVGVGPGRRSSPLDVDTSSSASPTRSMCPSSDATEADRSTRTRSPKAKTRA